jgi:hypothetical protein
MTLIVAPSQFASKAKLQENLNSPEGVYIEDPSMFGVNQTGPSNGKPVGWSEVVTNHPLRTKFAKLERTADGWKVR